MANYGVYGLRYDLKKRMTGVAATDTAADENLQNFCEIASRMWDGTTRRTFYPLYEVRYFDYPPDPRYLKIDGDLLAVDSFTTQNGDVSVTSGQYYLMTGTSYHAPPYDRIVMKSDSSRPNLLYSGTPQKSQAVTGWWGYHEDWANAWQSSQDTVENDPLTAAGTSITVNDADGADLYGDTPRFKVGQLLKIESEYVYVTVVTAASTNTLTVIRGVNGTTAAQHVQNTAIYVYRPMREVEQSALRLAQWLYGQKDVGYQNIVRTLGAGTVEIPPNAPADVVMNAERFKRRGR
jgi:hypothetical protein